MQRLLAVAVLVLTWLLGACSTDTFVSADAAAPDSEATGTTILCSGTAPCKAGVEMCCKILSSSVDECVPKPVVTPDDCKGGLGWAAACDDARDCPANMICCGTPQSVSFSARCTLKAECVAPKMILCDPNLTKPCETGACVSVPNSSSGHQCM